jgi:hypothetical protein
MAQELDFTDPEHAAGSTMAAFALAQLSFSALVTNELIPKAEAENMLKQLIKANEKGSIANEVAAALLAALAEFCLPFQVSGSLRYCRLDASSFCLTFLGLTHV